VIKPKHITWTKRIVLVLAIIPILIFLAFVSAVSLIDFNQYKPQIEEEVSNYTHRDFKIEGEVNISILPFMFHVGDMALKNPEGFEQTDLMTMKSAQIELSLSALFLEKKLQINGLELIEPTVHFVHKKDQNNWTDIPLLMAALPSEKLAKLTHANLNPNEGSGFFTHVVSEVNSGPPVAAKPVDKQAWSLQSLVIKNAHIQYSNIEDGYSVSLKEANLLTFDVKPNLPFQVNTDFVYEHSQSPRTFDFELNGFLHLAKNYSQLHLANWNGIFRLQLPKERGLPDIRLTTSGKNFMVDFKHQHIFVNEANLQGLDANVDLGFEGDFGANPMFDGVFEAKDINIKKWIENLGLPAPKMANEKAFTNAEGKFNWRWDGKVLELEKLEVQVDESKFKGRVLLPIAQNDAIQFELDIEGFNAEHYLVKGAVESAKEGQSPSDSVPLFYLVPIEMLQALNAEGRLSITDVIALNLQADKVEAEISAQQGQLIVAPFDWQVKEGVLQSKFIADLTDNETKFLWQGRTENLPLNAVIQKVNSPLSGSLESRFSFKTFGNTTEEWAANLHGRLNATLQEGAIQGLDMNALLSGKLSLNQKNTPSTEFEKIEINGKFAEGEFMPKRLFVQSERFIGSGKGVLDLKTQSVEGGLSVTIEKASNALSELQGLTLPLMYKGSMYQPNWSINLAELTPNLLKQSPILSTLKAIVE